jgi:hypothetical protein
MTGLRLGSLFAGFALCLAFAQSALAQNRVTIQVGYGPGGGYDAAARTVAGLLPAHLPGTPDVVVENVPGAGSLALARMVMVDDNRRGTRLATIGSSLVLTPIFNPESSDFDPLSVHYIAALGNAASYCVASRESGITTFQELLTRPRLRLGASGRTSNTYTFPAALRRALGAEFEIVVGFAGSAEIDLAMARGDIEARCGTGLDTIIEAGQEDRLNVIAELAPYPRGEIEGVDFALDFVTDPDLRTALSVIFSSNSLRYPIIMAPATPPDAVATMRSAFADMVASPEFAALNATRTIPYDPIVGTALLSRIEILLDQPDHIRSLIRSLVE